MNEQMVLVAGHDTTFSNVIGYNTLTTDGAIITAFGTLTNNVNGAVPIYLYHNGDSSLMELALPGTWPQDFFTSITVASTSTGTPTNTYASADAATWSQTNLASDGTAYTYWTWNEASGPFTSGTRYFVSVINDTGLTTGFNCQCVDQNDNETLSALRRRMLVRLGYSAQADNPPPGMADLLDDFLRSAQRVLYLRYKQFQIERFFKWTLVPGIRFYDFDDSDDQCTKRLDARTVTGVWLKDLNNVWFDMRQGIPPAYYTSAVFRGYPSRYELRSCIEIFPAPSAAYEMYIKGRFGLDSFTADSDQTTIDSELVFLTALSRAKAHYNQADASATAADANVYLAELIRSGHQGARYVPGVAPSAPWTKPHFLPLDNP